ncbi:GYF domain-containing protein mpd2 [Colletotrichum sojae]|uniref:GYF domain-containing protein mpd2 n=1 Tax=Colletotrichum sojae TaxID=2175907 RepID=A0A8H6JCQ0_9PEZI|nr:GYF domain-containing protein mpd2 [Colletotrichum sojae]
MPSTNLPSSFASAAAGQNASRDARGGSRNDGRGVGSGEWARRDGKTNGTLTFRRSSTTPGQASQPAASSENPYSASTVDSSAMSQTPGGASYDYPTPSQYEKDSILGLYRNGHADIDASRVLEPGWTPGQTNGGATRGWGKTNNNHNSQDPSSCWNPLGDTHPIGINGMSGEEEKAFASDVNSPLKPPIQNKEGGNQGNGPNGRKASLSHGSGAAYGLSSPVSASRPGTRRRETTDSNPFGGAGLGSPSTTRFPREDPAFLFGRKNNDGKEQDPGDDEGAPQGQNQAPSRAPFGSLTRSNTAGNPTMGANISALWGASQPSATGGGGMGSFGQFALPTPTSTIGSGNRGGSRFANLINKDGADATKPNEAMTPEASRTWRPRPRTDTDPFGGDDSLSGSAALGGAQDTSPPSIPNPSNIGMFETPVKGSTGDFGMSGLNLGRQAEPDLGSGSPAHTNPYRSPPAERGESHDDGNHEQQHGAAVGGDQNPAFSTLPRNFPTHALEGGSDRSQTSSAGPRGGYNTSGWPLPLPTSTPDRERAAFGGGVFGNGLFSPMATELQSPGLSGLGAGVFGPPSAGGLGATASHGRSKLGSLFPAAMQAQMQGHEQESLSDSIPDLRQANPLGAIGRNTFAAQPRDTGSPMRSGRGGMFEEMFPSDPTRTHSGFGGADPSHAAAAGVGHPQPFAAGTPGGVEFGSSQSQVRTMVMPDRMRWVYLDPQGQVQGPFSGLEMNDWYKANFFTPDLRVKKVEDPDFEPLGQLIRRIGNSREPFLVPQIGIPHGPPSQAGPFSPSGNTGVIPPLSGVFPSFGRTLTAEEQNNLERRKQEEQQAMAQQRDLMMRQQAIARLQGPGGVPGLHHQHSTHSLQSQPSFGSISSPIGAHPQQPPIGGGVGPTSGFFDSQKQQSATQLPVGSGLEHFREEDLATLNPSERQMLASVQAPTSLTSIFGQQPVGAPANESLRSNLPGTEQLDKDDEGFRERLQEFEDLRAEREAEKTKEQHAAEEEARQQAAAQAPAVHGLKEHTRSPATGIKEIMEEEQQLSLTQQVQKAQAAAAAAKNAAAGLPMPFPPPLPTSGTPLPAPTAQRARSNLPEQYNRSQSGTPDTGSATEPPPLAPWAKEAASRKGPSLKEIQEAEARKAAKAEELAAERRRQAMEQEAAALREREKAIASATGLPTTSTWGNGSPVGSASPWTKPGPVKSTPGASTPGKQKTLADIQREEELRKVKAKENAVQTGIVTAAAAAGKRYADLATKPNNAPGLAQANATAPPPGSGWATVGAGGKVKVPTGPAAQTRSVSAAGVKPTPVVAKAPAKPVAAPAAAPSKSDVAMDEFNKWVQRELSRGLTGVDIESFAATLHFLPLDNTIIADAIYASSKTMHGQHFAEEFIRRKKLAEKGVVEKQGAVGDKGGSSSSGWNEVAKKGGHKEAAPAGDAAAIQGAGYKVVPTRKKAGKKN